MRLIEEIDRATNNEDDYRYVARFTGRDKWYRVTIYPCEDKILLGVHKKLFTETINKEDYFYMLEYIRDDIYSNKLLRGIENTFKRCNGR